MARCVRVRRAGLLLLLFVCGSSAVVGPASPRDSSSSRARRPAPSCPFACVCYSDTVSCDQWPSGIGPRGGSFHLPPLTRKLSFHSLPNRHLDAGPILTLLEKLQWLRISGGELISLPSLPSIPSLFFLDLSDNRIQSLPRSVLGNTSELVHLNLSGNALTEFPPGAFQGLDHLKVLDISRNPLTESFPEFLFAPISKLKFLDLSNTNLGNFSSEWTQQLHELHFLNLSHNGITSLPHLRFPALEILDISHNPLLFLPPLIGFPRLIKLLASHTSILYIETSIIEGCNQLQVIDLSYSNLTNIDEDVFSHCKQLTEINLSYNLNLWRIEHGAFSNLKDLTILRLNHCPKLYDLEDDSFNGLESLRELYLQESGVKILPSSLNQLRNLTSLNLEATTLLCDCYAHQLLELLHISTRHSWKGVDVVSCTDGINRTRETLNAHLEQLGCTEVEVYSQSNEWVLAPWGHSAILECNVTGNPEPKIVWQTVDHHLHVHNKSTDHDHPWMHHQISVALSVAMAQADGKFQVLQSGQLLIRDVTRDDIGRYKCFAFNAVSNSSVIAFLGLEDSQFRAMILESILFGFACATLFLLITLLVQLIKYILYRLGCECCCYKNRLSPKAKQIRQLIEGVESYKTAQLDKLRENYTSQVVNIKDSCYQQMERLRDSYAQQSKNLKDLCDYSTQQITGARDQYLDQVNKVRDYSMSQMNRVRENYVFQRHRIRKFSGHQLLRLRETYKYQQKTLNKLLENLPDLYIQNCRTGSCQRRDSIVFDNEIDGLDVYYKVDFLLDTQSQCSDYYTPYSTLTRQSKGGKKCHSRNASTTSGGTEYQEAHSWVIRQESTGSERSCDTQRPHTRSFSIATPPSGIHHPLDGHRGHKRSVSASSHPSPQLFHSKPFLGLLKENGDASSLSSAPSSPKSSSKETPLYTPLTLTPVHDASLFKKKTVQEKEPGIYTSEDVGSDTPKGVGSDTPKGVGSDTPKGVGSDTPKGVGSDTPKGVGSDTPVVEPSTVVEMEVQNNNKPDCDSDINNVENICDSEAINEAENLKDKVSYETSL